MYMTKFDSELRGLWFTMLGSKPWNYNAKQSR